MNAYLLAVLIGIVEGITEFLPVSSTGHMLVFEQMLGLSLDEDPFWRLFTIVIQLGAILAVVLLYGRTLTRFVTGLFTRGGIAEKLRHPLILVGLAFVPSAIAGVTLKKQIDALMEHAMPIGLALILGAIAIEVIERFTKDRAHTPVIDDTTTKQALGIGVAQVVSLVPGVSRSGATIMGGLLGGLSRTAATDFSFLLSIPTMFAAAGYSLLKHRVPLTGEQWSVLAVGFVTAALTAGLVVAWFLRHVKTHTFRLFVVYRVIAGAAICAAAATGHLH